MLYFLLSTLSPLPHPLPPFWGIMGKSGEFAALANCRSFSGRACAACPHPPTHPHSDTPQ
jgi:hypothetical protein